MFLLILVSVSISTSRQKKIEFDKGKKGGGKKVNSMELKFNDKYKEQLGRGVKDTKAILKSASDDIGKQDMEGKGVSRAGLEEKLTVQPSPTLTYLYTLTSGNSLTMQSTYVYIDAPYENTPTPSLISYGDFKVVIFKPAILMSAAFLGLFFFCAFITVFYAKEIKMYFNANRTARDNKYSATQELEDISQYSMIGDSSLPPGKRALKRFRRKTDARMRRESLV